MVKYVCELCNYNTERKTEYSRHLNTTKHQQKVNDTPNNKKYKNKSQATARDVNTTLAVIEKVYKCNICKNTFSRNSSLSRHKKTCIEGKIKDQEIERIKQEAKEKEEQYKKQLETYEQLLKSMTSPQTINYYNYIVQNYPDAPALEGQKSYKNLLESKIMTLIDVICMYHDDNKIVNFIGDFIIKAYTKKEPKNQSIWSTDISRLTYIISESCNNINNESKNNWTYDKKGAKTKKIIIEPALNYVREQLVKFCKENGGSTEGHILKKMIIANTTIQSIDSGELSDKINKYIAPEFSVKLNDNKQIKL